MRMKKILILAATVALSAACSHNFEVNPVSKDGGQIGFGSWAESLTKARVQGSNTWTNGDDFAVYGFKDKTTPAPSTVFAHDGTNDVVVSYDGSKWDYDHHRFWDVNYDSYTFYAVSPASIGVNATALNPQTGVMTSASITFAGNDNDILVADEKTVNKTDGENYFNGYGTVPLVFNHVASLFDLKVKKHADIGDAVVAITSITLSNMDVTGTFNVSGYTATTFKDASGTAPVVAWTPTATGSYTNTSGVTSVATLPTDVTDDAAGDFLINTLIAMPQTLRTSGDAKQTVTISYTITPANGDTMTYENKSFDLEAFDDADDTDNDDTHISSWIPGKHYTYFITINAHAIMFSATINDWTTQSGYHYLVN